MSDTAQDVLRNYQRQLDPHGEEVGVSRQALDETLGYVADLEQQLSALRAKTEWVPVGERWPQKGQLIAARAFAEWDESEPGWVEVFDGNEGGAEFESWMLLPTPPTTEDGQ